MSIHPELMKVSTKIWCENDVKDFSKKIKAWFPISVLESKQKTNRTKPTFGIFSGWDVEIK